MCDHSSDGRRYTTFQDEAVPIESAAAYSTGITHELTELARARLANILPITYHSPLISRMHSILVLTVLHRCIGINLSRLELFRPARPARLF